MDGDVLGACAFGEQVPCRPGRQCGRLRLLLRSLRPCRHGAQAATVPIGALLGGFSQVVPEVPSVSDLEGLRGAAGGSFGEAEGPVTTDDLDAGTLGEPGRERVCLPVGMRCGPRIRLADLELVGQCGACDTQHLAHRGAGCGSADGRHVSGGSGPEGETPCNRYRRLILALQQE
ncbi:hypothetical protein GCM10017557_12290 [Streptomyces aurantiacus]|uniref:Uncharacterized protein n=1 Tax=Streptomyces aurantiacus TaxID=47760 RepID=A0A7G1NXC3_9ACTN|nr:hypothetical protein GCM10017557_12290 [Streptomyces aurantiacus]